MGLGLAGPLSRPPDCATHHAAELELIETGGGWSIWVRPTKCQVQLGRYGHGVQNIATVGVYIGQFAVTSCQWFS
jgi:hypothetical protein